MGSGLGHVYYTEGKEIGKKRRDIFWQMHKQFVQVYRQDSNFLLGSSAKQVYGQAVSPIWSGLIWQVPDKAQIKGDLLRAQD